MDIFEIYSVFAYRRYGNTGKISGTILLIGNSRVFKCYVFSTLTVCIYVAGTYVRDRYICPRIMLFYSNLNMLVKKHLQYAGYFVALIRV